MGSSWFPRCTGSPLKLLLACAAVLTPAGGSDVTFESGTSSRAIPFLFNGGHIYLQVGVNGSRPLSFLVDTGASHNVIDLRLARDLGMRLERIDKVDGGIGADHPDA